MISYKKILSFFVFFILVGCQSHNSSISKTSKDQETAILSKSLVKDDIENSDLEKTKMINVNDLINLKSANPFSEDPKQKMFYDTGKDVGFKAGAYNQSIYYAKELMKYNSVLNSIINFSTVMLPNGITPPVITQAEDIVNINSPTNISSANKIYKIIKPAKFVSVPPKWKDYLLNGLLLPNEIEMPDVALKPKKITETNAWKQGVKDGYIDGQNSIDELIEYNFGLLARDYTGMMEYSSLLAKGMVTAPTVKQVKRNLIASGDKLIIGVDKKKISKPSKFNTNMKKWNPVIQ